MQSSYINREASWLEFNCRVLEEAQDARNPLLERLRFLSIYCSNLDEFFMVRIGGLKDQLLAGVDGEDVLTHQTPAQQLEMALSIVSELTQDYNETKMKLLLSLEKAGIVLVDTQTLQGQLLSAVKKRFTKMVLPFLTAIIVDLKHPFPFLPNRSVFTAVRLKSKNAEKFGLVLFPEAASRVVFMDTENISFFLAEDAAARFAADIFPKHEVVETGIYRVTRNADLVLDDEALPDGADYRLAMAHILDKRKRLEPVRLQSSIAADTKLTHMIAKRLELKNRHVFSQSFPLDLGFSEYIIDMARSKGYAHLLYKEFNPVYVPSLKRNESVIAQTKMRDHLLIHPYISFDAILALLREAAFDPTVVAIRQTLYRVSSESEVVRYLTAAAQNGKEVTVVVELKARFDEESNLGWSSALEEAGCRVIYGGNGLKVHAKLLVITRSTTKGPRHTAHIGTGNYNENTTRIYTDIGLLTSDPCIADDVILLFRELGAGTAGGSYRMLSASPNGIRQTLCRMIDQEMTIARNGGHGHIIIKVNALSDKGMIDKLIEASQEGVKIDLIVRGICCIKAGVPGFTESIRVISIVGRFLEHARIYWFSHNDSLFISSADLMPRNLDARIEVLCPVLDKRITAKLKRMLLLQLCDTVNGRIMRPDGSYTRLKMAHGVNNSQMALYGLCAGETVRQQTGRKASIKSSFRFALGRALLRLGRRFTHE